MISAAASPTRAAKPYRPYTADRTRRGLRRALPRMPAATHHAASTNANRTAMVPTTATGEVGSSAAWVGTVISRNPRRARVDSCSVQGGPLAQLLVRLRPLVLRRTFGHQLRCLEHVRTVGALGQRPLRHDLRLVLEGIRYRADVVDGDALSTLAEDERA